MNKFRRFLFQTIAFVIVLFLGLCYWLSDKYTVPIMMYHSVNVIDNPEAPTMHPEMFELHMRYLKQKGYTVLTMDELVRRIRGQRGFPSKSVVITFDDGLEDNYTYAYRTLKEYGFPATFFVPAAKIGQKDRLNVRQLREMSQNGMTIASHTLNEAYLPSLSPEQQVFELTESKRILERELGTAVKYVSYPIGGFSDAIKQASAKAGYEAAFATNRGFDRYNRDVYELNRIRFGDADDSDIIMRVKLSGYYNIFRKLKAPN